MLRFQRDKWEKQGINLPNSHAGAAGLDLGDMEITKKEFISVESPPE